MEKDGEMIGHVMYAHSHIKSYDGKTIPIMTFGPISIAPEYKGQGYGTRLLRYSMQKAKEMGGKALAITRNIDFYGKSGFTYASEYGIRYHGLPEGADSSFFLCKELKKGYLDGIRGEYSTPAGYFVDEQECEEFDKLFPPKEKLVLPGQLL